MKAVFEYRDGHRYTHAYPNKPRGIYRKNRATKLIERPYRVTFIARPNKLSKEEEKWILDCKWALRKYDNTTPVCQCSNPIHSNSNVFLCYHCGGELYPSTKTDYALVDDLSDSPVSQDSQESIVKLMTQKIDPAPQTDKHIFLDALSGVRGETQKAIAEVGLQWIATLLKKNNDYGSSVFKEPVLAPGMPVVSAIDVRMSDKIARIQNLKTAKQEVKDESIQDTYNDLGSYCLLRAVAQRFSLPHVLTGKDVGTHSAHCPSVAVPSNQALSEIHYEQYRDALSKHFGKLVESYTNCADCIIIRFRSSFDQDLVLYYDKDHDQVAALPNIKLYRK